MEIKERTETIEIVRKTYVTSDGKEFKDEAKAKKHERAIREDELERYVEEKAIAMWSDEWSDLPGYFGCSNGSTLYLITVDEKVIEWAEEFHRCMNDLELGETVFLVDYDGDLWVDCSLDTGIKSMEQNLAQLRKWKEEAK